METMIPTKAETKTKYLVFKANIMDDDGNKILKGEVVELSPKLARRYNKLGFLRPFIEDEVREDDDDPDKPPIRFMDKRRRLLTPRPQAPRKQPEPDTD